MYGAMRSPWQSAQDFEPAPGGASQHREYLSPHPPPKGDRLRNVQLLVDSRDRDRSFDGARGQSAPFQFTARFDTVYGVVAAEVKMLSCPKPPGETYALLDIPQLGDSLHSPNTTGHQKFGAVFFEPTADVKPLKLDMFTCKKVKLEPAVDLNRLDVCLRTWDGRVLRGENANVTLVLDLTCRELPGLYGR